MDNERPDELEEAAPGAAADEEPTSDEDLDADDPRGPRKRIAILGLGAVGSAVASLLIDEAWRADCEARGHHVPVLAGVAVRDLQKERAVVLPDSVRITDDLEGLVGADDIDIVIELIGGMDAAAKAIEMAFAAGKPVISANKELLARRGAELEAAARQAGLSLRYEAAVAGGVPVLGPLVWDLGANRVDAFTGILNGTTNHILSTMAADARDYAEVLAEAQAAGYAEADPSSDIEGLDAAYKLALLIRLALGGWADVDALRRDVPAFGGGSGEGISGVTRAHLSAAARLGMTIKLIARARVIGEGRVTAGATPMAVSATSVLGSTSGVMNVIDIIAEPVGRVALSGPGAGGPATASAVLADVLVLAGKQASTWEKLPPTEAVEVVDDLGLERGWLVCIEGVGAAGFPEAVKPLALATTDEGVVTRPIGLTELTAKLGMFDRHVTLYPILSDP